MPHCRTRLRFCHGLPRLWPAISALALLAACTSAQIDSVPHQLGGLPEGAPQRPGQSPAYPPVHDMPPPRAATLLDEEQQKKLEADLIAARNRQPNQQENIAKQKKREELAKKAKDKEEKKNKASKSNVSPAANPISAAGEPALRR